MNETTAHQKILNKIAGLIEPMSYEVVHLELNPSRKTMRLFIDHSHRTDGVGIEDCVKVTRALDEPLDLMEEINSVFGQGGYQLEVSSPGIDRPLRTHRDFQKFSGREIRVHLFRPGQSDELENEEYAQKNPKQKNFLGTLKGLENEKIILVVNLTGGRDESQNSKKSSKKANGKNPKKGEKIEKNEKAEVIVRIPLSLISKANLEPDFSTDLDPSSENQVLDISSDASSESSRDETNLEPKERESLT